MGLVIREATHADAGFVLDLMDVALGPYYGGDHRAHGERILSTHLSGGQDRLGYFSFEQKMFVAEVAGTRAGLIHVVGKRQGTYKISPLIVAPDHRGTGGIGSALLRFAEQYAASHGARQMYCTVAEQNSTALQFFKKNGYIESGTSDSHYKPGITEVMLYKLFTSPDAEERFDRPNISVVGYEERHEAQVRDLLLAHLPRYFRGIDASWVDALFSGYARRDSKDINAKYKLIFVAVDRTDTVLGVVGATPKKGEPIKLMPFLATTLPAFAALLADIPFALKEHGRKVYIHITPTVDETIALQERGWRIDAVMPGGYHDDHVTQQWSLNIERDDFMRMMRVKRTFLDLIKKGQKTLEVRVGYDSINTIKVGERITFSSRTEAQVVRVADIRRYPTFEEMLKVENAAAIAPGVPPAQVLPLLKEIYPPDRERLGVVVLEIQPEH